MTLPTTMKAAILTALNTPLELVDVPVPQIESDEVLVQIEASGVCFTDVQILKANMLPRCCLLSWATKGLAALLLLEPMQNV